MADLQKYFRKFNDTIAIKRDQEKAVLAEKRDRILKRLADGIAAQKAAGKKIPPYRTLNQGSYPMGTGVKPVNGDYDLDVALLFDMSTSDCPDPLEAKKWVHKAIDGHTREVRVREPCVTVFYQEAGEHAYHVDFAIYAEKGGPQLARGKLGSVPPAARWEFSDPQALLDKARQRFDELDDDGQCRRVIRYFKRWKDISFSSDGHAAPRGIALTAAALQWFVPVKTRDVIANETKFDDARAMRDFATRMLAEFRVTGAGKRLSVHLPVPPGNDLFARMTDAQMSAFHERLTKLRDGLTVAIDDPDPVTAAAAIAKLLGPDFPVPDRTDTASPRGPAIISSGHSA
jgi:hypothetical protein